MSNDGKIRRRYRRDRRRETCRVHTNRHVYRFLQSIAGPLFSFVFRIRTENISLIHKQRGAFLILANHSSALDPFLLAAFFRRPVQYVISDSQIRSRFLSLALGLVGVIPKTKVVADLDTVKKIVAVKRQNGIIGIFPEGQTTWDGHALPIVKSTEKLVKSLKIPVYVAQRKGAYFTWPRWSPKFRRGEVCITFQRVFTPEKLRRMTTDEIGETLKNALDVDAFGYQRRAGIRYQSGRRAEYLERALFACPTCRSIATLHSHRSRLTCRSCGYSVHFNAWGFFEPRSGPLHFETIRDWNVWQLDHYRTVIDDYMRTEAANASPAPLLREPEVMVKEGYKALPLKHIGVGPMELVGDSIVISLETGDRIEFPIHSIEGINVQNNEHLEFYLYNNLYRITTVSPRGNTYKWDLAVRHIQTNYREEAVLETRPTGDGA